MSADHIKGNFFVASPKIIFLLLLIIIATEIYYNLKNLNKNNKKVFANFRAKELSIFTQSLVGVWPQPKFILKDIKIFFLF